MWHKDLITPNIDKFANEGMRFTNALEGAPVCGPTRAVLLTGLHSGHTSMRSNNGFAPIQADEPMTGGEIYNRDLIEKDRKQSPTPTAKEPPG